jgi:hypothetical protein
MKDAAPAKNGEVERFVGEGGWRVEAGVGIEVGVI